MHVRSVSGWAVALAGVAASGVARGQSAADVAARRGLIEQAQQRAAAGDHAAALDLAERAGGISTSPSLRAFLAQEHHALGQLAEALGEAEQCVTQAQGDMTVLRRSDVIRQCSELVRALRPQVGRVTVRTPHPMPEGLTITVAGHALRRELWDAPYTVTPGNVAVDATAPGRVAFHQDVPVVAAGEGEVTVDLPPAPTTPGAETTQPGPQATAQGAGEAHADARVQEPPPPRVRVEERTVGPGPGPYVLAGVGAAGLLAGGAMALFWRHPAVAQLDSECPGRLCLSTLNNGAQASDVVATARTATLAVDVTLVVGGAALLGGVAWWLFGRHTERVEHRVVVAPLPGGGMVGVEGRL